MSAWQSVNLQKVPFAFSNSPPSIGVFFASASLYYESIIPLLIALPSLCQTFCDCKLSVAADIATVSKPSATRYKQEQLFSLFLMPSLSLSLFHCLSRLLLPEPPTNLTHKAPKSQEKFPQILELVPYIHLVLRPSRSASGALHPGVNSTEKQQTSIASLVVLGLFPYTSTFPHTSPEPPRDLTHTLHAKPHRQSITKLQNFRKSYHKYNPSHIPALSYTFLQTSQRSHTHAARKAAQAKHRKAPKFQDALVWGSQKKVLLPLNMCASNARQGRHCCEAGLFHSFEPCCSSSVFVSFPGPDFC